MEAVEDKKIIANRLAKNCKITAPYYLLYNLLIDAMEEYGKELNKENQILKRKLSKYEEI